MMFVDAGKDAFSFVLELGAQWWTVGWCWWYTMLMTYACPSYTSCRSRNSWSCLL